MKKTGKPSVVRRKRKLLKWGKVKRRRTKVKAKSANDIIKSIKERFKHVLGPKEPIVVVENLSHKVQFLKSKNQELYTTLANRNNDAVEDDNNSRDQSGEAIQKRYKLKDVKVCLEKIDLSMQLSKSNAAEGVTPIHWNYYPSGCKQKGVKRKLVFTAESDDTEILSSKGCNDSLNAAVTRNKLEKLDNLSDTEIDNFKYHRTKLWQESLREANEPSASGNYAQYSDDNILTSSSSTSRPSSSSTSSSSSSSSLCFSNKRSAKKRHVSLIASDTESDRSSINSTTKEAKPEDSQYKSPDRISNSCLPANEPLGFCCNVLNNSRDKTQKRSIYSICNDKYSSPSKNSTKSEMVFLQRQRTDLNYIQNSFDNSDCQFKDVTAENIKTSLQQIDHINEVANANDNKRRKIECGEKKIDVICNISGDNKQGLNKLDSTPSGTYKNTHTFNNIKNDKRDVCNRIDKTSSFVQDTGSSDKTSKFLPNTPSVKKIKSEKRLPKITTDSILPKGTIKTSYITSDLMQIEKYKPQYSSQTDIQSAKFVTQKFQRPEKDFIEDTTFEVLTSSIIKTDATCASELRLTEKNTSTISELNIPVLKSSVSKSERIHNEKSQEINEEDTDMLNNINIAHNVDSAKNVSGLNYKSEKFELDIQYKHDHCAHNDTNNNEKIANLHMPMIENDENNAWQTTKLEQEKDVFLFPLNITESKIEQTTIESNSNASQGKDTVLQNEHRSNILGTSLSSSEETKVINNVTSSNLNNNVDDSSDEDDDCISLFTDLSSLEDEERTSLPAKKPLADTDKVYNMSDAGLKRFIEETNCDFERVYDANNIETNASSIHRTQIDARQLLISRNIDKTAAAVNSDTQSVALGRAHNNETNAFNCSRLFLGFCHSCLRIGNCSRNNCRFQHNLGILISKILHFQHDLQLVLNYLESQQYRYFTEILCKKILSLSKIDEAVIIKIFDIMYRYYHITNEFLKDIVVKLFYKGMSSQSIISRLLPFITPSNYQMLNFLMSCVKEFTKRGEYWNSVKCVILITRKNTAIRIVEDILRECVLQRREYAQDIDENLVKNLVVEEYNCINKNLIMTFTGILSKPKPDRNVIMQPIIASHDVNTVEPSTQNCEQLSSTHDVKNELVPQTIPKANDEGTTDKDNDNHNHDNTFVLHEIENLSEPCSELSKARFWKFYLDKESLQKGLQRKDYNHVISVLRKSKPNEESLFLRACYNILCHEVEHSQLHLSNIIRITAETGTTVELRNILIDVAIRILIRLTDEELWVLAYRLLKDINTSLQLQKCLHNFDAIVIILFAKIYLANDHPVEALDCFRQCNIIYTNRNKWLVPSNEEDDYIRARVITLLLDVLCIKSVDHAFFLFQFLVDDQWSNFYPIDLTRFIHKLVPKFLSQKQTELTLSVGRLVDKYNFTLNTITYRAIISTLVHSDVVLARQLYQSAVSLGIYSVIKFYPVTRIFVNMDLTEEEMYLMILDLIQQLLIHIGHGIDRVKTREFSVYVIFEMVPSEEQLYQDKGNFGQYNTKLKNTKQQLERVLQEKFDPPIKLVGKKSKGNVCKLNSTNLKNYLTSGHWEGLHFALVSP